MPHIVETATTRLNITADGLQGILYKINLGARALRMAGVPDRPDICMCPANKLVATVRMLEQNRIVIPGQITTSLPSKGLVDLPNELLGTICGYVLEDAFHAKRKSEYFMEDQDELLLRGAFQTTRLLITTQQSFGINSRLRSIIMERVPTLLERYPLDWTSLYNVLGFGREFYNNHFIMGAVELYDAVLQCAETMSINIRLHDQALARLLGNVTLAIGSGDSNFGRDYPDIHLQAGETGPILRFVHFDSPTMAGPVDPKLFILQRIKKVFVPTARRQSHEPHEEHISRVSADLKVLKTVLPELEELAVSVNIGPKCWWIPSADDNELAIELIGATIQTLRTLPIKRKLIFTSHVDQRSSKFHPDLVPLVEGAEMTDAEAARAVLYQSHSSGYLMLEE